MTNAEKLTQLRTEPVGAVLDLVRDSGHSAFPNPGERVATVVMIVAMNRDLNPVQLQAEIVAYADALDASARAY